VCGAGESKRSRTYCEPIFGSESVQARHFVIMSPARSPRNCISSLLSACECLRTTEPQTAGRSSGRTNSTKIMKLLIRYAFNLSFRHGPEESIQSSSTDVKVDFCSLDGRGIGKGTWHFNQ